MDIVNFTDARANLKAVMDKVADDKAPVVIHRRDAEDMVLVSKSEWDGIQETLHLLSSPRNAQRLLGAISGADRGAKMRTFKDVEALQAATVKKRRK